MRARYVFREDPVPKSWRQSLSVTLRRPMGLAGRGMFGKASGLWTAYGYGSGGLPGWGRKLFAHGDPMTNSAIVAVIMWLARNFPDAPVTIDRNMPDGQIERVRQGPAGAGRFLRLMERPNPAWSGALMWMATAIDYYTAGNAYWVKVRSGAGLVQEYWWIPERMMEPRWEGNDFITYYEQNVDGEIYKWKPDDVLHFRYGIDPENPRKGRSPLKSVLREIFTDNEAAQFTATLLHNLGVPGVIIAPANTSGPIKGKADVIKSQFKATFGGDNRGDPMVLTSPTEVKVLSWSPEQLNLRDIRKIPEERISAVLGVAAVVAGLGAGLDRSTFNNFGEARKAAYQEAIIPSHRVVAADLENQGLSDFEEEFPADGSLLDVFFDWTKASSMLESANELHKRALEAAKAGMITRAQFKRETGRPVDDGDDVFVIANNFTFVAQDQKPVDLAEPVQQDQTTGVPRTPVTPPKTPPAKPVRRGDDT